MSLPELRTKTLSVRPESFPKSAAAFDWLLYVGYRLEELVWQCKYLLFGTGFLLFLVYELAHFAKFLLKNWAG
jgi:hypothetical protein